MNNNQKQCFPAKVHGPHLAAWHGTGHKDGKRAHAPWSCCVPPGTNQPQESLFQERNRILRNRERGSKVRWWWSTILPISYKMVSRINEVLTGNFVPKTQSLFSSRLDVMICRFIKHCTVIRVLIFILFYVIFYLLENILYSSHWIYSNIRTDVFFLIFHLRTVFLSWCVKYIFQQLKFSHP